MLNRVIGRVFGLAILAGGAAAGVAGARYARSKHINAAEQLGRALLDTRRLHDAAELAVPEPESAMAACAAYLINVAHQSAAGMVAQPTIDPMGFERKCKSDDGTVTSTVITTAHEPEARWQFEMEEAGLARVSGSRRLESARFTAPRISMRTPDTISIRFENGYTVHVESNLEFGANLIKVVGPQTELSGKASLSDNRGNVGCIIIEPDGAISGAVTRGTETIGGFEGSLAAGMTFRQYNGAGEATA